MSDQKKEITYIGPRGYPKDAVTNAVKKETADLQIDLAFIGGLALSIVCLLWLFVASIRLLKKSLGMGNSRSVDRKSHSFVSAATSLDSDPLGDVSELTADDLHFDKQKEDKEQAWRDDLVTINYEIDRDSLYSGYSDSVEQDKETESFKTLQQGKSYVA